MRGAANNLCETYPAQPEWVGTARRDLTDFAAAAGANDRQLEAVRLASSEALTNVVMHAYRGEPGYIHVTAALVSNELWVLIADDGCGLEPQAHRPGLGLGLGLIAQLTDHLTIAPRASGGTEVRMRFNLVGAGRPGAHQIRRQREHRPSARIAKPA
jgi:anti-sigma regulatory factor (Ser/Thr protein kinase)